MVCKSSNVTVDKFKSLASFWGVLVLIEVVFFAAAVETLSLRTVLRRLVAWEDAKRGVCVPAAAADGIADVLLAKRDGAATKAAADVACANKARQPAWVTLDQTIIDIVVTTSQRGILMLLLWL
jgi:hypothetical protein